jgi:hypothetical protein
MARDDKRSSRLAPVVASLITAAWTVSFALDIFIRDYDPHASITPLMLAAAGYLFGGEVASKIRKPEPKPEEAKPNG